MQLLPSLAFARAAARDPQLPIGWAISPLHPALTIETLLPVRVETWPLRPDLRNALLYRAQVWMFSHYLGLSPWALAFLGFVTAAPAARRFALGAIAVGLVFAGGIRNEWLQEMIGHIPLVSGLRFPTDHLAGASLGLSLLAAGGITAAATWTSSGRRRVLAGALVAVAACAVLFYATTDASAPFDPNALIRPSLAVAVLVTIVRAGSATSAAWLLPALVALDLLAGNSALNPTTPSSFFRDRPAAQRVHSPRFTSLHFGLFDSARIAAHPGRPKARPTLWPGHLRASPGTRPWPSPPRGT